MVQLSLQWFLAMCEARSFVGVFKKLQEVQCLPAFLSWSLFSLLARLLFGLLVVSVGALVSVVLRVSAALVTSVFSLVVQGFVIGPSVLFEVFGVEASAFPSALTVAFILPCSRLL